jgi:hypothetical protein
VALCGSMVVCWCIEMNRPTPANNIRRPSLLRTILGVMLNPGSQLQSRLADTNVGVALGVSGFAFLLLFLQTGLDRWREHQIGNDMIAALSAIGLLYGTVGVAFLGLIGWSGARLLGGQGTLSAAIRAFGLAYSPTLIYAGVGLFFNVLLGWNTAVAFGATGLLWALGPMAAVLRDMVDGRSGAAATLATVCGLVTLLGWAYLAGGL